MTPAEKLAAGGKRMPNGCLEWQLGCTKNGYGEITVAGVTLYVHRLAWEVENGPIPDGEVIRHKCDNPPCFDLAHLLPGTQAQNVADMLQRGRARYRLGEQHPKAKLTWPAVREIRRLIAAGFTENALALEFGVCGSTIHRIAVNKIWKEAA